MADVRLDRLLREEELLADLPVDETVGDELEDLDLARRRLLLELTQSRRLHEGDHGPRSIGVATRSSRLESAAVVAIAVQDLPTLSGVHAIRIGVLGIAL
jgi:hypothetical protein